MAKGNIPKEAFLKLARCHRHLVHALLLQLQPMLMHSTINHTSAKILEIIRHSQIMIRPASMVAVDPRRHLLVDF